MRISGTVTDIMNTPLEMANVIPLRNGKSFGIGTVVLNDGTFALESNEIDPDTTIKISYLGFKPKFLKASDVQDTEIVLEESFEQLDEVVITAPKKQPVINDNKEFNKKVLIISGGLAISLIGLVLWKHYES